MGKLVNKELRKLLSCIRKDPRVIVPPMLGYDSGVHQIDGKYLVISTDPCISVPEKWFGWLLINYAASDVALFGAKPEYCAINLLGSPSTSPETFYNAMNQACKAADELQMTIVTGHTGTYNGLSALLGVCTAYGTIDKERLITPNNAKHDDFILCTKPIGLETLVNFALAHKALAERLFGVQRAQELSALITMQSCVKEALVLSGIAGVHAMRDATEGGLTAALNEMAETSGLGFRIECEKIPVLAETHILQDCFQLSEEDLLSMSSTGTILAAVAPEAKDNVQKTLRQCGLDADFLGVFTKSGARIIVKDGKTSMFPKVADDPYERILFGKA